MRDLKIEIKTLEENIELQTLLNQLGYKSVVDMDYIGALYLLEDGSTSLTCIDTEEPPVWVDLPYLRWLSDHKKPTEYTELDFSEIEYTNTVKRDHPTNISHYMTKAGWEEVREELLYKTKEIKFLGHCKEEGDIFSIHRKNGVIVIAKGIAGKEFN
jgi:hypothetical protein